MSVQLREKVSIPGASVWKCPYIHNRLSTITLCHIWEWPEKHFLKQPKFKLNQWLQITGIHRKPWASKSQASVEDGLEARECQMLHSIIVLCAQITIIILRAWSIDQWWRPRGSKCYVCKEERHVWPGSWNWTIRTLRHVKQQLSASSGAGKYRNI